MAALPACSLPPTVLVELLEQLCDEVDQKWIQLESRKKKKKKKVGRKSLPGPFPNPVPHVTSPAVPGAGMSGLDEEGRGCLSQHVGSTGCETTASLAFKRNWKVGTSRPSTP